jgi:hypothetical protein
MQKYLPGTNVPLTFSLLDDAGVVLAPTKMYWRIMDNTETPVKDWALVLPPDGSIIELVIPATLTVLASGVMRGIRQVELKVTTENGTFLFSQAVILSGDTSLSFGVNSFQTYLSAMLAADSFIEDQLPGWTGATRDRREKALVEAYGRIMLLPIGMHFDDQQSMMTEEGSFMWTAGPTMLRDLRPSQIASLYKPLLAGLLLAQLLEADDILTFDPFRNARLSGITSMSVGESSQSFRASKPLELPVSLRALARIERWVRFGARIQRS